ncbi:hypothetical protein [Tropicimonas marinistellae]|uniref:hypothetical protein n=1 Tax=Tropicimonas marinistellae TaxID=1739787 RepID=UPI00082A3B58|nr:hypothetical protein [Tropicimonas marinistellae]
MTTRFASAACAIALIAWAGTASAEPFALTGHDDSQWRFVFTPYAFIPAGTHGTSTVDGSSVDLDLGLEDALDALNLALSGRFEAWRGDWGLLFDGNYVSLGGEDSAGLPGPGGGSLDVEVDIEQYWLTFLGAYRAVNTTYGDAGRRFALDLQGGLRYNSLKQEVDIDTPGPSTKLGGTETWWEPVIGARGVWELNDNWAAAIVADFGGFGVGGDDLQVIATAGFDWRPERWQNTSIKFGYRYYSLDYETDGGDFAYDVTQHGPYLGVTFRWQ